jgi:hypothetical protein
VIPQGFGSHITDQQVRRYMQSRKDGHTQAAAAARAGFSESTARRLDKTPVLPSQRDRVRRYRTRPDPFVEVWREELVPMLQAMPSLRATTLLEELQRRHAGRFPDRLLRSPSAASRIGGRPKGRSASSSSARSTRRGGDTSQQQRSADVASSPSSSGNAASARRAPAPDNLGTILIS